MAAAASSPTCSSRATASRSTTSSSRSDGRGPGSEALRLAQPFVAVGTAHGQRLRLQVLQDGQFYLHPGAAGAPEVAIERLERADRPSRPAEQDVRSEEHTSELQSLMRSPYAGFCLKKK